MSYLILIRHGESEWNKRGKWTGRIDVDLTEAGREEARLAGQVLRDIPIHIAYTSALKRTRQTYDEIERVLGLSGVEVHEHQTLNERDHGMYTGTNKWELKQEIGEEEFNRIRRHWDVPMPGGESLKDVYARVVPFCEEHLLPAIAREQNILVVAHGNTLRALIKHLDEIDDVAVAEIEVGTGCVYCYEFDDSGKLVSKTIRTVDSPGPEA